MTASSETRRGLPDVAVAQLAAGDVVHTHPAAPAYRVASKRLEHGSWTVLGADGVPRFYAARAAVWRSRTDLAAVEVAS